MMAVLNRRHRRKVRKPMVSAEARINTRLTLGHAPCGDLDAHGRHNFDVLWTDTGYLTLDPGAYRGRHRKGAKRA
jgi:hypothetical protein